MGGDDKFVEMLDSVFTVPPIYDDSYYGFPIHEITEMTVMNSGNYAHGNQPVQHMIYLYDYAGQPWKAQYWVRDVMNRFYSATPDGYCGDEDNGQTSAWYVFSALGFYPVCPASDEYVMGTPLFEKATLHLENGKTFTITAKDNSHENFYIESAKLNSRRHTRNYITYDDIMSGGKLSFVMSSEPNTSRGTAPADRPYSFSREMKSNN
jgi:predicted alpha-1,2-mannosidase